MIEPMGPPVRSTTVETARLVMTPVSLSDLPDVAALWREPDVYRHIGGRPFSEEDCWNRLLRDVGHWVTLGYGLWTVRMKATGTYAGVAGFADFRREMSPSFGDAPEGGWVMAPWTRRQGLASEAVGAALDWVETVLDPPRTVCMIAPDNQPSLRLADRFGYAPYAATRYKGSEVVLLERLREGA
ncbi:MAG: GNAT family N-acetyltransferase [Brevundimonas sp.]|uniref:GNAT family N-acetyltransferase n=1 Tax=Brevundimonas sp. TaxID=1871086 RepID=UPI00391CE524